MPQLSVSVTPDSVQVPPPQEVIVRAAGGVPPYAIDTLSTPAGISAAISGSPPQWSVIISGQGQGTVELEVADSQGDRAPADIQVN